MPQWSQLVGKKCNVQRHSWKNIEKLQKYSLSIYSMPHKLSTDVHHITTLCSQNNFTGQKFLHWPYFGVTWKGLLPKSSTEMHCSHYHPSLMPLRQPSWILQLKYYFLENQAYFRHRSMWSCFQTYMARLKSVTSHSDLSIFKSKYYLMQVNSSNCFCFKIVQKFILRSFFL